MKTTTKLLSKSKIIALTFFFLIGLVKGHAQVTQVSTLPLYQTGKIYLKIKSTSNERIAYPTIQNDSAGTLAAVFATYSVTNVVAPFAILDSTAFGKTYRVTFSDTIHTANFISALTALSTVQYAEKVPAMYTFNTPNDPNIPYHLALVNANAASSIHIATGNAVVAIVDDAVLSTHEDLAANISTTNRDVADLDNNANPPATGATAVNGLYFSHGTHVAGIAGGVTNNSIGIASVGWNNKIMCVKARKDNDASGYITNGFDGVAWAAANGAHVINMSWGGSAFSQTDYNVTVSAKNNNIVLVAAAGNYNSTSPLYPAAYGEGTTGQSWEVLSKNLVVAVAALDASNNRSVWGANFLGAPTGSNFGPWVDISAYGSSILSTIANSNGLGTFITNQYASWDGTSMATPIVSGIAGVMKSYDMTKTADQIINCLLYTANPDIYNSGTHPNNILNTLGIGRVDAQAALECISPGCSNPIVTITPSSLILCPSSTITLTANSAPSYTWSTGAHTQNINVTTAGVYTCSVTYTGGCLATRTINIQAADPNAHILLLENSGTTPNDGILCAADFLNVEAFWGNSYQWDAFGGETTPGLDGITSGSNANDPVTNVYTCTVTGVNGCPGVTSTVSVSVHWNKAPTLTVSPATIGLTSGCSGTITATGSNTYTWTPVTGLNVSTGSIVIASPTVATIYTVTATDTYGCFSTATNTVTICSGTAPSYTISSSGTYSPTSGYITQNMYIGNGTNTPSYTISCTDLKIAPSVFINVANNATLTISGSWLHVCGTCGGVMWNGIKVQNGGKLIINNYSIIEDADTAIAVQPQPTGTLVPSWNISNTIFNMNGNDLVVYPNFANMSSSSIYNTIFTCRNLTSHSVTSGTFTAIKSSIAAATPLVPGTNIPTITRVGTRTSNHIYFNEAANTAGISVGNSAQGNNIFDNADFGINSGLTPITVKNNSFLNLTGNSTNFTGIGVYVSGASWEVGTPNVVIGNATSTVNNAEKNYFTNCLHGVQIFDCQNVAINNNTFNNETTASTFTTSGSYVTGEYAVIQTGFAIHSSSLSTTEQTTFCNNNVQNCATGYYLDFGKLYNTSSPITMTSNTITAAGSATKYCNTGIFVQQSNTAGAVSGMPITAFSISQNVISKVNTNCISVHNVNNVSPTGGFLNIQTNTELSVKPSTYTVIQSPRIAAVRVDGSYYTRVADNPIHCTGVTGTVTPTEFQAAGIYVTQSPNSSITCNTISNIGEGIVFEGTSPTYNNNISRNQFDYIFCGFVLRSGGICGDQGTSTFPHDNIWTPSSHFYCQTLSDGSNPNGGTTSKLYCRSSSTCTATTIYMPCTNYAINTATAYVNGTTLIGASGSSSQTCASDGGGGGSGGRMAASNNTFDAGSNTIDTAYYQNIQSTISDTHYTYPTYDNETRWALQHYVSSNSPNLTSSNGYVHAKVLALADAAFANQDYSTALSLTNSFASSNVIESNYQTVNNIVVKMQRDTLNANDVNNLQQVAVQCHLTGGSIVWRARALLNAYYKTIIEYPNACPVNNDNGNRNTNKASIENVANSQMVNVYPNPNTGKMTMEYNIISDAELRITDVTGKQVGAYTLNAAEKSIELNHETLINGVYLYTVINEQGLVKTGRIVIMK